ncbi:ankyrin, partial [Aspergillus sclerotiicarbonarius CBS 121057]
DDREMEVLEWLTREQGPGRHHEVRSRRTAGTGRWMFEQSTFKDWVDPASSTHLLWCVGGPGCGKSTLMSFVVDELKTSSPGPEAAVAYYYCDYRARTTEPLLPALGSLVRTFSEALQSLPRSLQTLFDACRRERRPPMVSELEGILSEICGSLKYPFVLIDALDEFSPGDPAQTTHFACLLDALAQKGARVFVMSRAGPETSLLTPGYAVVNYAADNADIRTHVAHALHTDDSMIALLDSQLEEDISNTIVSQASGMFLLAVLHLQNIRGQVSRAGIRRSLSTLSRDLGDAYDKTFEAITHQSQSQQKLAFDALLWVASSYRPLSALELRHALATRVGDDDWDIDDVSPLGLIVKSCCGLLSVDNMNDDQSEVRLVHHTLQEYLQSRQPTWFARAHEVIAQTSLTCLLFKSSGLPAAIEKISSSSFAKCHALVPFARRSWGFHAAMTPLESYRELAMRLFNDKSQLSVLYPDNRCISGLHIAAGFGLTELILHMVKNGLDVETFDSNHQSPLQYSCAYSHTKTALQLLKLGANPNHLNIKRDTPLFLAVGTGNKELATILLDHGASPGQLARDNWVPLHKAADAGYYHLVKLLLRQGASISSRSAKGVTALHRAAGRGHIEIMAYLLSEEA